MLKERIKDAVATIERKSSLQSQELAAKRLQDELAVLAASGNKLEMILNTIDALHTEAFIDSEALAIQQKEELLEKINACGQALSEYCLDHSTVVDFKAQVAALDLHIASVWSAGAQARSSEVSGYLSLLGDLTSNPVRAQTLLEQIKSAPSAPPTSAAVKQLSTRIDEAQKIVLEYKLTDEIKYFLQKVKDKKASIEDLSPEVISWLKENNLMKKMLISF